MRVEVIDKSRYGLINSLEYEFCGDVREDLITAFDFVYSEIFSSKDEVIVEVKNHNEYYELNKIIVMYMEDMEKSPMWFDRILLIAMINAKYDYLYRGYEFDDYNFDEFKEARGL